MAENEMDQLQDIMDDLPESSDYSPERRKYSLTQGDVMLIYKIAKVAANQHVCPFGEGEPATLKTVAQSINRTHKIASGIIIVGIVSAILSGLWYAIVHVGSEWVHNGGALPK